MGNTAEPVSKGMDWYNKRKAKMFDYLGGACARCGETKELEIDHIDPSEKSFTLTNKYSYAWSTLVKELDKCQLLCFMCHAAKTASSRPPLIHNRWRYLRYGCRCDICRLDRNKYRRERYAQGKKV